MCKSLSGDSPENVGLFFGIPATGKKVDADGVTLVRMENEMIKTSEVFKTSEV